MQNKNQIVPYAVQSENKVEYEEKINDSIEELNDSTRINLNCYGKYQKYFDRSDGYHDSDSSESDFDPRDCSEYSGSEYSASGDSEDKFDESYKVEDKENINDSIEELNDSTRIYLNQYSKYKKYFDISDDSYANDSEYVLSGDSEDEFDENHINLYDKFKECFNRSDGFHDSDSSESIFDPRDYSQYDSDSEYTLSGDSEDEFDESYTDCETSSEDDEELCNSSCYVNKQISYLPQTAEEAAIEESIVECKLMREINNRKIMFQMRAIVVNGLNRKQSINHLLEMVDDCVGSYVTKSYQKRYLHGGRCSLYFTSEEAANDASEKINTAKLNNGKVTCSSYKENRLYSNFKNVNLIKLIGASNVTRDITAKLQKTIGNNCEVVRKPTGYYEITMKNQKDASVLFSENTKIIDDAEVLLNYYYDQKNTFKNDVLPVVTKKRKLNESGSLNGNKCKKRKHQ